MVIELTTQRFFKNPDTKTTYLLREEEKEILTEDRYNKLTSKDWAKFNRRLGGVEIFKYTSFGKKVIKIISISPDRQNKIIYNINFKN